MVSSCVKPAWSTTTKQYLANHGEAVNFEPFTAVLRPVWDKCCTREVAAKSFMTAGIVPFNPSTVPASGKFGPSCIYRTTQANPTHTAQTEKEQQSCADAGVPNATVAPSTAAVREDLAVDKEMPCPANPSEMSPAVWSWRRMSSMAVTDEPSFSAPASATIMMEVDEPSGEMDAVVAGSQVLSSSTTAAEVISEAVSQPNTLMNLHQLKAFKGMIDFVVKYVKVNEYECLFEALAGTRTEPHPKLDQFVGLFQAFKTSIKDEAASSQQSSTHQALTEGDILQLPKFAKNKGKRTKETTPTIPHCISHKDFRDSSFPCRGK